MRMHCSRCNSKCQTVNIQLTKGVYASVDKMESFFTNCIQLSESKSSSTLGSLSLTHTAFLSFFFFVSHFSRLAPWLSLETQFSIHMNRVCIFNFKSHGTVLVFPFSDLFRSVPFALISISISISKVMLHYCKHTTLRSAMIWKILLLLLLLVMTTWPSTIFKMLSINSSVYCPIFLFGDGLRSTHKFIQISDSYVLE